MGGRRAGLLRWFRRSRPVSWRLSARVRMRRGENGRRTHLNSCTAKTKSATGQSSFSRTKRTTAYADRSAGADSTPHCGIIWGGSAALCGRGAKGGQGGGAHDSTARARGVVVQPDHVHHPRDFAGRVDIVGPVPHAGGHDGGAVLDVRADGRDEAARARREPLQRGHSQVGEDGLCRGKYTISGMLAGIGTARTHAPTGTRSGKRAL